MGLSIAMTGSLEPLNRVEAQAAQVVRVRTEGVWKLVYQRLPELPLENQYVNKDTRRAEPENTLIGRLIRYHVFVKGRSAWLRFDWKLTLADYLGVNEPIEEATYPSGGTLRSNPYAGDIAAIRRLTRAQRESLGQTLVEAFAPQVARPAPPSSIATPQPSSSPTSPPPTSPEPAVVPPLQGPGAAQLLKP
jgi:hypothetical protein